MAGLDKRSVRTQEAGDVEVGVLNDADVRINPATEETLDAVKTAVESIETNQQTDALTDAELRATPVEVDTGLVQGLTDTELRATPVAVTFDDVTGDPKAVFVESSALAAQATATLSGTVLGASKTGSLNQVTVSSEVPFKAVVQKFDEAATPTTVATLHGEAGATVVYEVSNKNAALFQVDSDASPTAKFQVVVTNNNASGIGSSGAVHATIEWDERDV